MMLNELKPVGFFSDLPYGQADERTLASALNELKVDGDEATRIVDYLRDGAPYVLSPGLSNDIFSKDKVIGAGSIKTDGVWMWHSDLSYYVGQYGAALPAEFIDHMRENNWKFDKQNVISNIQAIAEA